LKELLHFFYTDNVDDIGKHAKELLMASEKYNLPKLKKMSEESLCKNMKIDSVIELAAFANLHNGHSVTKAAIDLIVKNFPKVIRNPDWPEFVKSHSDILVKIHDQLATRM
jgi:speckle-type POZ protein